MIIYLYVKTHNVTGLKYLGKTIKKDPHKYTGSGLHWVRHLKTHGYDYTTEILNECTSKEEVKKLGLYYSELWNIVESAEWANIKPENGDGGDSGIKQTQESIAKGIEIRKANDSYKRSPKTTAKILATKLANGTMNSQTPDSIAKGIATRKANGTLNTRSPESIAKCLATKLARGNMNSNTPESVQKCRETKARNKAAKEAKSLGPA